MTAVSKLRDEAVGRYEAGTFRRIADVLRAGESRSEFIRQAVERALSEREEEQRRERALQNVAGWIV